MDTEDNRIESILTFATSKELITELLSREIGKYLIFHDNEMTICSDLTKKDLNNIIGYIEYWRNGKK